MIPSSAEHAHQSPRLLNSFSTSIHHHAREKDNVFVECNSESYHNTVNEYQDQPTFSNLNSNKNPCNINSCVACTFLKNKPIKTIPKPAESRDASENVNSPNTSNLPSPVHILDISQSVRKTATSCGHQTLPSISSVYYKNGYYHNDNNNIHSASAQDVAPTSFEMEEPRLTVMKIEENEDNCAQRQHCAQQFEMRDYKTFAENNKVTEEPSFYGTIKN